MIHIKHRWPLETKIKARELRKLGYSFTQITKELGVVKSTLSLWLEDLPKPLEYQYINRKDWLNKIRILAHEANKKKYAKIRDLELDRAHKSVADIELNLNLKKSLISMLYWSEGAKGSHAIVCFANTDPKLMLLFVTLFRECYPIEEKKLRVRLHLHYYHRVKLTKNYWSKLLNIPESQFGKIYHKKRSKEKTFRKNIGGICFLKYNSVYLQREISQYGIALADRIVGIKI